MHTKYIRIINAFFGSYWAIQSEKLEAMATFLRFAARGGKYSAEEVAERIGTRANSNGLLQFEPSAATMQSTGADKPSNIAVIPITGIIAQKASNVDDISGPGGTSTERASKSFRAAMNDATVKAVILHFDTPGGTVYGVDEFATEIYKARGQKPIVAMVDSLAASAGYYLAASADEIVITPGGEAGSIGVYSQHTDISKWLEDVGEKITLIHAGEFKVEGNPFEPLTEEGRTFLQGRVDEYYGMFVKSVARGRGISTAKVKSDFGQGRVLGANDALKVGMVDRIATFEQTVQRLIGRRGAQAEAESLPVLAAELSSDEEAPAETEQKNKQNFAIARQRERQRLELL